MRVRKVYRHASGAALAAAPKGRAKPSRCWEVFELPTRAERTHVGAKSPYESHAGAGCCPARLEKGMGGMTTSAHLVSSQSRSSCVCSTRSYLHCLRSYCLLMGGVSRRTVQVAVGAATAYSLLCFAGTAFCLGWRNPGLCCVERIAAMAARAQQLYAALR